MQARPTPRSKQTNGAGVRSALLKELHMSTQFPSRPMTGSGVRESPWASGLTIFAAVMMVISGVWQALAGIAALVRDTVYVTTPDYIFSFDLTGWGWVHLLLGILAAVAGFAVLQGQTWARVVGIVLAGLSMIANLTTPRCSARPGPARHRWRQGAGGRARAAEDRGAAARPGRWSCAGR
jgi:hypothetical protein